MTETNIILKVQTFTFTDPIITVELTMSKRSDALDIADKLNDIAKAKKKIQQCISYKLLTYQMVKKIAMTICHFNIGEL